MEPLARPAILKNRLVPVITALSGNPVDRRQIVGLEVFEHRKFAQMGELLPAAFHGRYFTSATQTYALAMCQYARG